MGHRPDTVSTHRSTELREGQEMPIDSGDLETFQRDGYVVIPHIEGLDVYVEAQLTEFASVLGQIAERLLRNGEIKSLHEGLPLGERFLKLQAEYDGNLVAFFESSLSVLGSGDTPLYNGPALFNLFTCEPLLDTVQPFIGPEIYVSPAHHTRFKLPSSEDSKRPASVLSSPVPWHQDQAGTMPEADDCRILTVWLPLTDTTLENGCLRILPGSHRDGLVEHCPEGFLHVPEREIDLDRSVPVPVPAGGALIMHEHTLHASDPNRTKDELRISLDLRYQAIGTSTGRPSHHPGFIARSLSRPWTAQRDPALWEAQWAEAKRIQLGSDGLQKGYRWDGDAAVCA